MAVLCGPSRMRDRTRGGLAQSVSYVRVATPLAALPFRGLRASIFYSSEVVVDDDDDDVLSTCVSCLFHCPRSSRDSELAAVGTELPRTRHHVGARAARRSIEFLVRVQRGKLGRLRSVVRMRAAGSHQALWWRAWEQAVRSYELRKRALLGGA